MKDGILLLLHLVYAAIVLLSFVGTHSMNRSATIALLSFTTSRWETDDSW